MKRRTFLQASAFGAALCTPLGRVMAKQNTLCVVLDDAGKGSDLELMASLVHEQVPFTAAVMPEASGKVLSFLYACPSADIMLHQPMEPVNKQKSYNNEILAGDSYKDAYRKIRGNYEKIMGSLSPRPIVGIKGKSIVGINNHQGSLASQKEHVARAVVTFCKDYSLILLDSYTHGKSTLYEYALRVGLQKAYKRSCDFLDNKGSDPYRQLEKCASYGRAIAIGHWKHNTIEAYTRFHKERKDLRLVRISEF
jgi:polysaccharide deacetylase 2 family uncharacterized protein YibQ